ncbi:retrovirus-related pol polyprotein from transposon TNT 1-94 [Tanacetum coccineum]
MNHQTSSVPQIAYQSPQVFTQPMTKSPLVDSGFVVVVFSLGDDPIACLNKAMAFLTTIASLRFPSTNNQLRTSSNPRNQATIQDGRVIVQQVQGRQAWYKDKSMLAEAQEARQILDEEQLTFLADPGVPDGQAVQAIIPNNAGFQIEDLDTYDFDSDDISNAKAVLMVNISNYGSDIILVVPYFETYLNDMENQSVHTMQDFEQLPVVDFTNNEIHSDSNIIPYSKYLQETQLKTIQDTTLETTRFNDLICYQNSFYLKKAQRIKPTLYDGIVIFAKHVAMPVIDDEETLILEEESRSKMSEKEKDPEAIKQNISHKPIDYEKLNRLSEDFGKRFTPQQELSAEQAFWFRISNPTIESSNKPPVKVEVPSELPKVSLVNASLKKLKFHLAQFDSVVKKRTTPDARTEGEWGFEHTKAVFNNEIIPFLKSLKDIFNVFDKDLLNEIMEVQTVLTRWKLLFNNLQLTNNVWKLLRNNYFWKMIDSYNKSCENRAFEITNAHNDLLKSYSQLEKHCISLELSIQLNQEIFQKDESCNNQNALEIPEYFENNDLKAQLQDKNTTICKLKEMIKSIREKSKDENDNYDYCEIETKNVELENSVAKLLSENERLCKEINHVKQVFKDQFDSIKKTRVRTTEQSDSLIDKLNLKCAENEDLKAQIQDKVFVITSLKNDLQKIVDIAAQIPSANTIVPGMFKLDLDPLAPRLLQNKEAHIDYLKYTQEQADILRGIELLVYVRDTFPNAIKLSGKKVVVTPKNNVKKVRFAEPLTSSSNIKQVESSITSDFNTPVLSLTGLKCSTSKCGSKPTDNKKNDRISQTPSRNMKNKVEAQPRKVNKKNRVVEPIRDVDVKHSLLKANSELICATCKKSMFDDVHDMCLLDFVENVNSRAKSAKKHKNKIFGNLRVMITSANVVPPKKTTSHSVETQKLELKVYNRKPKNIKNVGSSKKAKIVESNNANHSEPNHTWGSNATDIPSSSSLVMTGTVRFGNDHIARIMGYGDYQLGNVTISRVYYVEALGHNLFSVGQFCDADLEGAFWKNTCFIRNLEGVDLLSGSRDTNLYTFSLDDMLKTSLIYLLSKASKTKSWLWHRHLSHLNFGTLNNLAKDGLEQILERSSVFNMCIRKKQEILSSTQS